VEREREKVEEAISMIHAETAASILRIALAVLKCVHFTLNGIRLKLTSLKVTVKSIVGMEIRIAIERERERESDSRLLIVSKRVDSGIMTVYSILQT